MLSAGDRAGLEVFVEYTASGRRLNEYQVVDHPASGMEPPYTQAFLECEQDSLFKIVIRKTGHPQLTHDFSIRCHIDKREVPGSILSKDRWSTDVDLMYKEVGGDVYGAPLLFAELEVTSDPVAVTISPEQSSGLGSIVLTVEKGAVKSIYEAVPKGFTQYSVGVAHEKDHKLASTVVCGDRTRVEKPIPYATFESEDDTIFCKFIWNYRSRPKLVAMGIIHEPVDVKPPASVVRHLTSPSHPPEVGSEPDDRSSAALIQAQRKLIQQLEVKMENMRQEAKRVKGKSSTKEAVDLTQDVD